jgi:hypothetical protein
MAAAKRNPIDEASPTAVLAELDRRVAELAARDKTLFAEQLELDAAGVLPSPPSGVEHKPGDAASMLDSGTVVHLSPRADVRLFEIIRERKTIASAIALASQRGLRLRIANQVEMSGDITERWAANISKTVRCVLLMRELAAERARLRDEYVSRTGLAFQGQAGVQADRVVGRYTVADAAQAFLEAAAKAGIN